MITFPNAKINLGLSVVAKRADGYHNLETVFYPIGLKDALEVIPRADGKCVLHLSGIQVGGSQEDNLVVKAFRMVEQKYNPGGVDIYLYKHIPSGAGMGGGSSDASFMLLLLNDLFSLGMSQQELEEMSGKLGADCPFFCRNVPVYAEGTGNEFESVDFTLKGYYLVVIKPDVFVSTKDAFSGITPRVPLQNVKDIVTGMPVEEWKIGLKNDFEETVFARYPRLAEIKNTLYEAGAIYASMSGSGSSLFGIFDHPVSLKERFPNDFVWEGICE
ncbi:MAG: 4-(cytidine 5'-diphospho)-2-C-methyl-D-erythritol kinase [Bacteroidales bacterium]